MIPFLNIHTHRRLLLPEVESILSLSVGHDDLKSIADFSVALGIHPWFMEETNLVNDLKTLIQYAVQPKVKMIGECGLDSLKGASFEVQLKVFEVQLNLAKSLKKPVILHCVKAYDELIAVTKKINPMVPMILHGFNKSEQLGQQLLGQGFLLSFGKAILNANSGASFLLKNMDNFFLETDDAELDIEAIYTAAANLKNITVDELKALIFTNWNNLNLI
jgi:TatD DNase family protein